jgi:hypothetical protein
VDRERLRKAAEPHGECTARLRACAAADLRVRAVEERRFPTSRRTGRRMLRSGLVHGGERRIQCRNSDVQNAAS